MDVRVPQLAEGVNSGTVVSIQVSEGDSVKKDQILLELETEKAVAPVQAPQDGKVSKIQVKEGDSVTVGQVIFSLSTNGTAGESSGQKAAAASPEKPQAAAPPRPAQAPLPAQQSSAPSSEGGTPPASPSIRKLARQLGIDLGRVRGTAHGGRITLEDVRVYVETLQNFAFQAPPSGGHAAPAPAPSIDFSKWGDVTVKPMTTLRKKISEKMIQSWTTIPHVTQFDEADITGLLALRKKYLPDYEKKGSRLTVTAFVFKAAAEVLKQNPVFNASMDEQKQEIVFKNYYHIGMAVDTEQGLIVPVLRDVDKKSLLDLSRDINALAEKTRARKVSVEDLQGGTFTISNQGGIGGAHFTPIINKPEVAILGVGQGAEKVVVRGKKQEVRMMVPLALSYDHRVIDGGKAAKFISDYVKMLQEFPESWVRLAGASGPGSSKKAKAPKKGKK